MKKEHLMAGTTVFLWATLPPMTKLLLSDFPSMTLLFYSSALAAAALLVFLLCTGCIAAIRTYSGRDFLCMTGLGFLGNFLYSALYYQGLTLISSSDACILNYLWPVAAVIFSCVFLKERLTVGKTTAILLSFLGIVLVASKGAGGSSLAGNGLTGCVICVLSALCYGLFNVLNKKFGKDQWINMTYYFALAALPAGIASRAAGQIVAPSPAQWVGICWLGLCINAVGIVVWAIALQGSEVSSLVNFAYATPVIALFLSVLLLKETVSPFSCAGLVLILGSFFLQKKVSVSPS